MANLSSAYGYITLQGSWAKQHIESLIKVFDLLGESYYFTAVDTPEDLYDEEHTTGFYGSGRWAYIANLENFHSWVEHLCKKARCLTTYRKLVQAMRVHNLTIDWEVYDEESGNSFIHVFTGYHEVINGELVFNISSQEEYPHTLKNMNEYYDEGIYVEDVLHEINKLTGVDVETIFKTMADHEDWYNISCWIDSLEDIPPALLKALEDK